MIVGVRGDLSGFRESQGPCGYGCRRQAANAAIVRSPDPHDRPLLLTTDPRRVPMRQRTTPRLLPQPELIEADRRTVWIRAGVDDAVNAPNRVHAHLDGASVSEVRLARREPLLTVGAARPRTYW